MTIASSLRSLLFLGSIALTAALPGCGGGGGGGGTSGVRVLHGAIDAAPVDLLLGGTTGALLQRTPFAAATDYSAVPEGKQSVLLTRAKTASAPITSYALDVQSDSTFSILLYGDNETFGLRTTLLDDSIPDDGADTHVRVVDGATGAAQITASISGAASTVVDFGGASAYVPVKAGTVTTVLSRRADGRELARVSFTADPGHAYTVMLAGEADYYVKPVVLTDR